MTALHLFLYTFAAFGFAFVVGHAKISLPFREWLGGRRGLLARFLLALAECPPCVGFWVGVAAAFRSPFPLLLPFYTVASNFILGRLTGLIEV